MKGNVIKILTLIVLLVLVIVTFKLTGKNEKASNSNLASKVSSSAKVSANGSESEPKINKEDDTKTEDVVPEETNVIKQYKLYNKYVLTDGNAQYKDVDYKYYIIRTYNEYKQYVENYFKEYNNSTKYNKYNEGITDKMTSEVNGEFFNDNSLVILVDVNKKKEINGKISEISINDEKELSVKVKKEIEENLSNSVIYVIPVEKGIKTVKLSHIN